MKVSWNFTYNSMASVFLNGSSSGTNVFAQVVVHGRATLVDLNGTFRDWCPIGAGGALSHSGVVWYNLTGFVDTCTIYHTSKTRYPLIAGHTYQLKTALGIAVYGFNNASPSGSILQAQVDLTGASGNGAQLLQVVIY